MIDEVIAGSLAAASSLIQQAFAAVFNDVNRSADTWYQRFKLKSVSQERYAEYIVRTVGTFPLFGTTKFGTVDQAYVRIALSDNIERYRYKSHADVLAELVEQQRGRSRKRTRARDVIDVVSNTGKAVAIVGTAGSGKTTALRHLAVTVAKGHALRGQQLLPIFLSVRDFAARDHTVATAAVDFLGWLDLPEPAEVFASLLAAGDVLLLVDGLDEVDDVHQRSLITEIVKLVSDYPKAVVCVTARPYTLDVSLPGFEVWETLPLKFDDRLKFVKKWFAAVEPEKGEQLLLQCAEDRTLLDLGSNPLLLSMICALYFNDLRIPAEPDELYARVLDGLMGAWDAFRNIARRGPLAPYSVRRRITLLTWVAWWMLLGNRRVFTARHAERAEILDRFADSSRGHVMSAGELLRCLYNDFGVLVERAPGVYSFSHLSFQEYLAAQYVVDNRCEFQLLDRTDDQGWEEVLRLTAKMLPDAAAFMQLLTERTRIDSPRELNLLAQAWNMRPMVDRPARRNIGSVFAARVESTLGAIPATYESRDGVLHVRIDSRLRARPELELLRKLHLIARVFKAMDVWPKQVGSMTSIPFELLGRDKIYPVVVDDA